MDPFFFSNCKKSKNTSKHYLFSCQKQTDNRTWLILSTYITDMCTNITKKVRKSNIRYSRNLKITVILWSHLVYILGPAFYYINFSLALHFTFVYEKYNEVVIFNGVFFSTKKCALYFKFCVCFLKMLYLLKGKYVLF